MPGPNRSQIFLFWSRLSFGPVLVRWSLVSWKISEKLRLQHRFQFVIIPNKSLKPQKINLQFLNFPQKSPIKTDKITDNFVWWPKRKSQIIKRLVNFWFILIYSGFQSYRRFHIRLKVMWQRFKLWCTLLYIGGTTLDWNIYFVLKHIRV